MEKKHTHSLEHGEVAVRFNGLSPFSLSIDTAHHALQADEPQDQGGADSGPAPFELLLASLGACTAMTLRMYADYKKIELPQMEIRLREAHMRDAASGKTTTRITRTLIFLAKVEEELKNKLVEVADKCPVHRTLTGEIHINTEAQYGT